MPIEAVLTASARSGIKRLLQEDRVLLNPVPEEGVLPGPPRDQDPSEVRVFLLEPEGGVTALDRLTLGSTFPQRLPCPEGLS